ncbi:MAG: DUF58 domain-containing protein [Burkholderiaceae bacterium]|nr:DUF58 domain-containing protein [Burkholderiaceae bacterium]
MSRAPQPGEHRIGRRDVAVVPSAAGMLFGAALAAMLLAALNYQLTLGYALTFLVLGVAIVSLLHTVRNLSVLTVRGARAEPVFAGQHAEFTMIARNATRNERYALALHAPGMAQPEHFDVPAGAEQFVSVALPTARRGWMTVPRFTLATTFPVGIWRARTRWQPAQRVLVFPAPETPAAPLPVRNAAHGEGTRSGSGNGDPIALRPYAQGDSPQRIAWKAVARSASGELVTLQRGEADLCETTLDWDALPSSMDDEARLSRLTRWTIDADATGARFALRLPGVFVEADSGPAHRRRCLEALATWSR